MIQLADVKVEKSLLKSKDYKARVVSLLVISKIIAQLMYLKRRQLIHNVYYKHQITKDIAPLNVKDLIRGLVLKEVLILNDVQFY